MSTYEHYTVLGCSKESSYEELKSAYRKLILQHHPDKIEEEGKTTSDKYHRIEEAWKVLRDPDTRQKYNAQCRQDDLESQSVLIYASITMDDMKVNTDNETLSYPCRCGSYYLIDKADLVEKNCTIHIPCQECTFVVVVDI